MKIAPRQAQNLFSTVSVKTSPALQRSDVGFRQLRTCRGTSPGQQWADIVAKVGK
jgi:hypothetical protein